MDRVADAGDFANEAEVAQAVVTDILQNSRRRERQRLRSRGFRNHYTSYKTDSGEDCSPHE
eukprot:14903565-Heterocapsa_arctica.AAC.1